MIVHFFLISRLYYYKAMCDHNDYQQQSTSVMYIYNYAWSGEKHTK